MTFCFFELLNITQESIVILVPSLGITYTYSYSGPSIGECVLSFSATEDDVIKYVGDIRANKLDPLLRNYVGSATNSIFTDNASVSLPWSLTNIYEFSIHKLLFGVLLYNLRQHNATRYAANGVYNNLWVNSNGGDAQPDASGLPGECMTLMFKGTDLTGNVGFHFMLTSLAIGFAPYKRLYLELYPLTISGSSNPYTINDYSFTPTRNIRLFTNSTTVSAELYSNMQYWIQGGSASAWWYKPEIFLVYNNGNNITYLSPIEGQSTHTESITISGCGASSVPVYLYKTAQITTS